MFLSLTKVQTTPRATVKTSFRQVSFGAKCMAPPTVKPMLLLQLAQVLKRYFSSFETKTKRKVQIDRIRVITRCLELGGSRVAKWSKHLISTLLKSLASKVRAYLSGSQMLPNQGRPVVLPTNTSLRLERSTRGQTIQLV